MNNTFEGVKETSTHDSAYEAGRAAGLEAKKGGGAFSDIRHGYAKASYLKKMNLAVYALLLYTAAHNAYNAFERAQESWFMFAFVILGVLSMEWYIHTGLQAWMKGEITKKQIRIFKGWGALFFTLIVLGVVAGAQAVDGIANMFIDIHYHWILPAGTVMVLPAIVHLNAADEIRKAVNEGENYRRLNEAEKIRESYEQDRMDLIRRQDERVFVFNLRNNVANAIEKKIKGGLFNRDVKASIKTKADAETERLLLKAGIVDAPSGDGAVSDYPAPPDLSKIKKR